jgi:hypothetical protein
MTRATKVVLALLCIICVLALCIAPWVDPPETTLKSLQVILFLMSALAVYAFWLAEILARVLLEFPWPIWRNSLLAPYLLLSLDTGSILRC